MRMTETIQTLTHPNNFSNLHELTLQLRPARLLDKLVQEFVNIPVEICGNRGGSTNAVLHTISPWLDHAGPSRGDKQEPSVLLLAIGYSKPTMC